MKQKIFDIIIPMLIFGIALVMWVLTVNKFWL